MLVSVLLMAHKVSWPYAQNCETNCHPDISWNTSVVVNIRIGSKWLKRNTALEASCEHTHWKQVVKHTQGDIVDDPWGQGGFLDDLGPGVVL